MQRKKKPWQKSRICASAFISRRILGAYSPKFIMNLSGIQLASNGETSRRQSRAEPIGNDGQGVETRDRTAADGAGGEARSGLGAAPILLNGERSTRADANGLQRAVMG